MSTLRRLLILLCLVLSGGAAIAPLQAAEQPAAAVAPMDLVELCFSLATIQEPDANVPAMREAFATLVEQARTALVGATDAHDKVKRLCQCLLIGRHVSYLSNKYWRDSTLAASLLRHHGNCISTTILFVTVGQRLGLPIHGVLIPGHAFARWEDGPDRINIETTSGGDELPDEYYHDRWQWLDADAKLLGYGTSLDDRRFACVLHGLAGSYLAQLSRTEAALAQYDQAIALWPNDSLTLQRAWVMYQSGARVEACTIMADIANNSSSLEARITALVGLAGDLQAHSQHDQALAVLRQAYAIAPPYLARKVLQRMSDSYRALRRFAESCLCQELSIGPSSEADDWTSLAILYKNADRLEDAIRCLRLALKKNPESWSTRLILAGYLIRGHHDTEGWDLFKTVEKPRENEDGYYTNMAWFYASVGKKAEFLDSLSTALSLSRTPQILDYVRTEVDFDPYRSDPAFKALIVQQTQRLEPK